MHQRDLSIRRTLVNDRRTLLSDRSVMPEKGAENGGCSRRIFGFRSDFEGDLVNKSLVED